MKLNPIAGAILSYELGDLSDSEILELFSELISTKMAWGLQGHYGQMANALIENGCIDSRGNIADGAQEKLLKMPNVK